MLILAVLEQGSQAECRHLEMGEENRWRRAGQFQGDHVRRIFLDFLPPSPSPPSLVSSSPAGKGGVFAHGEGQGDQKHAAIVIVETHVGV